MANKVTFDVDGSDIMSQVILDLLNQCPALENQTVAFATLDTTSGLAFFPASGAAIESEREDVLGHVTQVCSYPFSLYYRVAPKTEKHRLRVKELLDTMGKWLEREPITIIDTEYQLEQYPDLTREGRKIKSIRRGTPGYLGSAYQDGIEDWTIQATLRYENNFNT